MIEVINKIYKNIQRKYRLKILKRGDKLILKSNGKEYSLIVKKIIKEKDAYEFLRKYVNAETHGIISRVQDLDNLLIEDAEGNFSSIDVVRCPISKKGKLLKEGDADFMRYLEKTKRDLVAGSDSEVIEYETDYRFREAVYFLIKENSIKFTESYPCLGSINIKV